MRRMTILGASILALALAVMPATASGITATVSTSCGELANTAGGPAHIIASGVSCTAARKVMKDFSRLGPFHHFVGTNHANGYSIVDDNWHCTLFMGHSACKRGSSVIRAEPQLQ
jgi:hypothetical protein